MESDALRVEAQAFEIDAGDETSEHPQGGRGVKIAGTSVVALEFVDKVGLGSTHCLEPADHCGADNHRAIGTVAGAPLGHCVVAFVALLILESESAKWSRGNECGRIRPPFRNTMLRFLIGWVRRSPETLTFSQLRIAKKKPRSRSW